MRQGSMETQKLFSAPRFHSTPNNTWQHNLGNHIYEASSTIWIEACKKATFWCCFNLPIIIAGLVQSLYHVGMTPLRVLGFHWEICSPFLITGQISKTNSDSGNFLHEFTAAAVA